MLNVQVQAISGQGNAFGSTANVKLDVKFQITFEPDSSYGYFTGWKAFADYNTPDQKELTDADIKFDDASALKTEVIIYKEYKEIRILPTCEKHASINYAVPKNGADEAGTISPYGTTAQPGDETFSVNVRMKDEFSFKNWIL